MFKHLVAISLILTLTSCHKEPVKSATVVYAKKNISSGETISYEAITEGQLNENEIPKEAIRSAKLAAGRLSGGIACGEILVPKQCLTGNNRGAWLLLSGKTPATRLIKPSEIPEGKFGVIDESGKWIIPAEFSEIRFLPKAKIFWANDLRKGQTCSDTWTQFDYSGKKLDAKLPSSAEFITWPQEQWFPGNNYKSDNLMIRTKSGTGMWDGAGNNIIPPRYECVAQLDDNCYAAIGNVKIVPVLKDQWRLVKEWYLLDKTGKVLATLPNNVDSVESMQDDGNVLCYFDSPRQHDLSHWSYMFWYGVVDKSGKIVVPPNPYLSGGYFEGLASARDSQDRYGYVDKSMKFVVPPIYAYGGFEKNGFKGGTTIVGQSRGGVEGVINRTGKVVIPIEYNSVDRLADGKFLASKKNAICLFDKTFKPIKTFRNRLEYLNFTGVSVENESDVIQLDVNGSRLRGVVDKNGNWLLKPVYEKLERCGKDRFIAKIAEKKTK